MKYKPNSRYLYVEQVVDQLDIALGLSKLDKLVFDSTKLQLANHEIILEFNSIPQDPDFKETKLRIGREILGYDSSVFSQFSYKDLSQRDVKEVKIELHTQWDQLFEEAKEHVYVKSYWRLLITDDFSSATIELELS